MRAREERARYLEKRAQTKEVDWAGLLEEFVRRVQVAERTGQPAVSLRTLPRQTPDATIEIEGLPLVDRHPTILFGDGGAAKSYLAPYLAGRLEQRGIRTAIFDWELAAEAHRDRLERLFGPAASLLPPAAGPTLPPGDGLCWFCVDKPAVG